MTVNFQAVVAAIISSTPLVWHFNDVNAPRPLAHICSILAQQYADEIVVSAENVVDNYFSEVGDKTKIYPTVSPDNFNEQEIPYFDERVNGNDDSTILGLVGNINPVKGYETFINAFEEVVNEHNDVVAMIAGRRLTTQKSYYQSLLRQIEEKGLEDKIHFLGWTENIEAFLSSIDLFVMPSHSETGPMTLMEAMVMKKPIVTTNVGVVPEQLINGEHAWIVESRSADQLATALNDALAMRGKWEDLGRSAKERAIDKFSLEAAVGRYYSVYDSINQ
jgi:glycosyltransferase involved in cell wall biosynthesis